MSGCAYNNMTRHDFNMVQPNLHPRVVPRCKICQLYYNKVRIDLNERGSTTIKALSHYILSSSEIENKSSRSPYILSKPKTISF